MSQTQQTVSKAARRLYNLERNVSRETGIQITRTATKFPQVTAKSFRLPSGMVTVDKRVMDDSFAQLVADWMGRVSAAERAAVPAKVQEFAQAALDMHVKEVRALQERVERALAAEWLADQDRHRRDFEADEEIGGKRAKATLASAAAAIDQFGRDHGKEHAEALRKAVAETGAGNRKAVIRFASWAGRGVGDRKLSSAIYKHRS